jgi:hypothetical protein
MGKAYKSIEHRPALDNRPVRRRNQKAAEPLMQGVRAGMGQCAVNLAELFYNGAPGIPVDRNRTLELYVTFMECDDFAACGAERWASFVPNLVGVAAEMEIDGICPIADRLQAACARHADLPSMRFAALYGAARHDYVRSLRVDAAEKWRQCTKMEAQLEDQPLMLHFVNCARHQIAKMQNTLDGGGDEGMKAINA